MTSTFSWKDREEITEYIFDRFGRDKVALLATYSTFQFRSVIRELAKVFGLPPHEIDKLIDKAGKDQYDGLDKIHSADLTLQ